MESVTDKLLRVGKLRILRPCGGIADNVEGLLSGFLRLLKLKIK